MEWTSQAVRGSRAAFARVYERHHRALYRYCRSLLGDEEEARDALQSTMTKAFAALRFEERDFELRPWLFRIAHNEAVSRLRQRREALEVHAADALITDSLAQTVEHRERLAQLRADLRELPERQRAALVMRELNGLGHAEIAAVLGGSPQTVKQTIFAARTALHECAEGREMRCTEVQRVLSEGDGRRQRSRRLRAHVRACRSCREFAAALAERPKGFAVLAPVAGVGSWLSRLLAVPSTKVGAVVAASATIAGATATLHEVTRATPTPTPTPTPSAAAPAQRSRVVSGPATDRGAIAAVVFRPNERARPEAVLAKPVKRAWPVHQRVSTTTPVPAKSAPSSAAAPAQPQAAAPKGPHAPSPASQAPGRQQPATATAKHGAAGHRRDDPPGHSRAAPATPSPHGQGTTPASATGVPPGLAIANANAPGSAPGAGRPAQPGASGRAHNEK
jgi:RNA polymerase sigma factor (sigma-70 family)